jgi:hypothetical protein
MDHLTVEDLLSIAEEILGAPAVTDVGLLDSAAHRLNGFALEPSSVDEAVEPVVAVAAGHIELDKLSQRLASWTGP